MCNTAFSVLKFLLTKAGGDQNGTSLRSATYSPNLLNQYSAGQCPGRWRRWTSWALPITLPR
jgi:hypothetical protein